MTSILAVVPFGGRQAAYKILIKSLSFYSIALKNIYEKHLETFLSVYNSLFQGP